MVWVSRCHPDRVGVITGLARRREVEQGKRVDFGAAANVV